MNGTNHRYDRRYLEMLSDKHINIRISCCVGEVAKASERDKSREHYEKKNLNKDYRMTNTQPLLVPDSNSTVDLSNNQKYDAPDRPIDCQHCQFLKHGIKRDWCKLHLKTKKQKQCNYT